MKIFLQKALQRLKKLTFEQIEKLLLDVSSENELFETVLYSLTDGIIVVNMEHKIIFINNASKRLIPFANKKLHNMKIWDAIADTDISYFVKEIILRNDKIKDMEFTLGNGYKKTIACSLMPFVKGNIIQGNLIHIEDITEKRISEARLRRAESLAALTTITAGVAHEIKNPLQSISIHIQLIQKQMQGKKNIKTDEVKKNLIVINEEVNRLNKVIIDFLFAVRPINANMEIMDINNVIKDMLEFMKYELKDAKINIDIDLGKIPRIKIDEKYLKQALLNIIQNALYAMPDGGSLKLKTYTKNNKVFIDIIDTGIGIPEEDKDKIFKPYFTTKDIGSGLGLTIVYKIIKEHKGHIDVDSKKDVGTTFSLSFPIPQKEQYLIEHLKEEN